MAHSRRARLIGLAALSATFLLGGCSKAFVLLSPAGPIGADEKSAMLVALGLMLIVVIPVFVLTGWFAWHYRASNAKATYAPKWAHSAKIELVVWLVPALIIAALGSLTWTTTQALGPYKPIASNVKPLRVDVVSLDWKWLFIYPELGVATVNRLVIPAGVPVSFRLTSDTVMTSFFIPRLGTQIYAMPGMRSELNLMARKPGTYSGRNFQFSGRGYSGMRFEVDATAPRAFEAWVAKTRHAPRTLDMASWRKLETPGLERAALAYGSVSPHFFDRILMQTMTSDDLGFAPVASKGICHVAG